MQQAGRPDAKKHSNGFSRLRPSHTVLFALLFAFLLFLSLDLLEAVLLEQPQFTWARAWGFLRGFLGTAAGMMFVWVAMRHKERELIKLRDELSQQLTNKSEEVATLKSDFLAVIKHRLRTPILATQRASQLLAQEAFGPITEQQREILQHVLSNNQEIDRILEMLVDIYRYKEGNKELRKQPCDVGRILSETVDPLREIASQKHISLMVNSDSERVLVDTQEIQKLLHHLVENAVKHARSQVQVSCESPDGQTIISVSDDGNGMPKEDVDNLFDRFFVLSSAGKYAPTAGVGLCLCAQIAKAHGGTIECTSQESAGTTFTVRLPHEHGKSQS